MYFLTLRNGKQNIKRKVQYIDKVDFDDSKQDLKILLLTLRIQIKIKLSKLIKITMYNSNYIVNTLSTIIMWGEIRYVVNKIGR